jgi:hypothetical protein
MCGDRIGADEPAYLAADGSPRCQACSGGNGMQVGPALRRLITRILATHPSQLDEAALPRAMTEQLGDISYQIIRHALERDLRSHPALRRMNAG